MPKLPSAALLHSSRGSSPELCPDSSWLQAPRLTCCRHLREALLLQARRWLSGCFLGCKGLLCLALVSRSTADLRWSWRNICISAQLPLHIWVLQNKSSCRFRLSETVCKGTSSSHLEKWIPASHQQCWRLHFPAVWPALITLVADECWSIKHHPTNLKTRLPKTTICHSWCIYANPWGQQGIQKHKTSKQQYYYILGLSSQVSWSPQNNHPGLSNPPTGKTSRQAGSPWASDSCWVFQRPPIRPAADRVHRNSNVVISSEYFSQLVKLLAFLFFFSLSFALFSKKTKKSECVIVSAILSLDNLRSSLHLFEVFHFPANYLLGPLHVMRLLYTGYL